MYYGIRGTAFEWFKSYLSGRTQQVQFNNCLSSTINPITSSEPQGSILGPLLFILYVNDFRNCLDFSTNVSFVMILTSLLLVKIYNQSIQKLILNLKILINGTVNSAKTKYLLFTPRKSNYSVSNTSFEVHFRNNTIEKVSSIRFLGIIINENLSWKEHMNMIKQKICSQEKNFFFLPAAVFFLYFRSSSTSIQESNSTCTWNNRLTLYALTVF